MTDEAKALAEWLDKTAWVQDTSQTHELGLHRADVLRNRIEELLSWKAAEEAHHHQLNHLIETQAREIERELIEEAMP